MVAISDRMIKHNSIIEQELGNDVILLNLDNGNYYSLDGVGRLIWSLCDGTLDVGEITSKVAEQYAAAVDTVLVDVIELLDDFASEALVARRQ